MPAHVGSWAISDGALGDGQHEDEVEEELERGDPLLLAPGGGEPVPAGRRRHRR